MPAQQMMPRAKLKAFSDVRRATPRAKRPGAHEKHPGPRKISTVRPRTPRVMLARPQVTSPKDAMDTGSEYYREGSRAVASTVKEQPLGALLVAGAVGFALALMLNRPPRPRTFRDYYR